MIGLRQKWYYVNYYLPLQQVKKIIHPPPPPKKVRKVGKTIVYIIIYLFIILWLVKGNLIPIYLYWK